MIQKLLGYTLLGGCGTLLAAVGVITTAQMLLLAWGITPRILLSPSVWICMGYHTVGGFGFNSAFFRDFGPFVAAAGLTAGAALGYNLLYGR